jgi:carboxypeptidase T
MNEQYISYDETIDFFKKAEKENPDCMKTEVIGETWEGREILLVTMTADINSAHHKPAMLFTGTIHAREWIGIELAVGFAKHLIEHKTFDPRIAEALSAATLYLVPCLNPDGFEYSRKHFSFWRKNRRQNVDGSFGVDLNRNFNVGFKAGKNPSSNIYSGPSPFSEPETASIKKFVDNHPNITVALDYHSQGNVFFPAHNFKHEDTIDTTDMNTLCANMAHEIKRVSGREYGIHQGKPPASLIAGSGREFYYSKGAIATVVEVGTQNISDYQTDMRENINEHIPALLVALAEAPNYAKTNPLPRVSHFKSTKKEAPGVHLSWECNYENDYYFELYRSLKDKDGASKKNLIAITKNANFIDENITADTTYHYKVRAVCVSLGLKSPFAPKLRIRTIPKKAFYSKMLFSSLDETGYLGANIANNKSHFGQNSLFVGISEKKGECLSLLTFNLSTIPANAIITDAKVSLYPINRVSATIEKYGEWNVGIMAKSSISDIYDFNAVKEAHVYQYVGRPTKSQHLTQGIWRDWKFSHLECKLLQDQLIDKKVHFRVDGPKELIEGRNSQIMEWDLGYGKFGYGLGFRPKLEISYTLPANKLELKPFKMATIKQDETINNSLSCGYDANGNKIYGYIEFDLSTLPDFNTNIITNAISQICANKINASSDIRFHIEFIEDTKHLDFKHIQNRDVIEKIGFETSTLDFKNSASQDYYFDSYAINTFEKFWKRDGKAAFIIKPTSLKSINKNMLLDLNPKKESLKPKLILDYLPKRRFAVDKVTKLTHTKENGLIKLSWENPSDKDFNGVIVINNPFREPCSPYDGQKIYGGKDNYTYDNFGAIDVDKFYAVFTYDNVPNYSDPSTLHYTI